MLNSVNEYIMPMFKDCYVLLLFWIFPPQKITFLIFFDFVKLNNYSLNFEEKNLFALPVSLNPKHVYVGISSIEHSGALL